MNVMKSLKFCTQLKAATFIDTVDSYSEGSAFKSNSGVWLYLTELSHNFSQFLRARSE